MKRRVVITGMGAVTALSCQLEDLWKRVCAGESGIGQIKAFDTTNYKVKFGGEISNWSTVGYIPPKDSNRLDRFCQFGVVAAMEAIRDAGIDFSKEDPFRGGCILGSGIGGLHEIEEQHTRLMEKGPDRVSAFTIPKMMVNAAPGQVSIQYGLRGPTTAVATACASASNAIGDAVKCIQHDEADVMISGGTEAAMTQMGMSGFANMKALSMRNDAPQKASRPFDRTREGFVIAEGAGVVVLEELEHAKARGAKIYAELVGYGCSSDAGHITQPDENGTGAARAMQYALRDARLSPDQIGYINAHGTSTPLGDAAETKAIKKVFQEQAYKTPISSTKSQLGHLLGASGGVEIIFTILAMRDKLIPPTINLDEPDPACDLDYTPHHAREKAFKYGMSNSFGFGGHNASLIVSLFA